MKLADYLLKTGRTPATLRREFGILGRSTVTRWCTGDRIPTPATIDRIERWSKGEVRLRDFLDWKVLPECAVVVTLPTGRRKIAFPWSNRTAELDACLDALAEEDAEGDGPTLPVQKALATLGSRRVKQLPNQQFLLDGRPTDPRGLVTAANRERSKMGLDLIDYLGSVGRAA